MTITSVYEAAYLKAKGFELGKVRGYKDIEILGNEVAITNTLQEYHSGGQVNAIVMMNELQYVKYLAKRA